MEQPLWTQYQQAKEHGSVIVLYGKIDAEMVRHFDEWVAKSTSDETFVVLDTPGGEVNAGLSLYQELRAIALAREVRLIARTRVHSIGMLLLTAVPVDSRFCLSPTTFLLHPASLPARKIDLTTPEDDAAIREYQRDVAEIRRLDRIINERIVAGTRCDAATLSTLEASGAYVCEDQAIELGFVGAVLPW